MRKQSATSMVEFTVGPHNARPGWKTARITYDPRDGTHQRQVQAALGALIREQSTVEQETSAPHAERGRKGVPA